MRIHQSLQKKASQKKAIASPSNSYASRPFAVPAESKQILQAKENKRSENILARISILNPDVGQASPIQPKLTIGQPNDQYEQEADRVAKQVVQRLHSVSSPSQEPQSIQRQETLEDEDEELQMKPLQRVANSDLTTASPDLEASIQQAKGRGQLLTDQFRKPIEQAFGGVDFSSVKVHVDTQADRMNRSIQAKAFTTGQDIFFRRGAYSPGTQTGQELIAHELTHVVQQNGRSIQRKSLSTCSISPGQHSNLIQRVLYQGIVDDWVDGDKIYGLSTARLETAEALDKQGSGNSILDDLNNQFIGTGKVGDPKFPETYNPKIKLSDPQAAAFKQALESHPRYDPRLVPDADVSLTRVKRACKGGLHHTTAQGNTIHFILDILKMDMVIDKQGPTDMLKFTDYGDKARDITGSELRFLYRNRNNQQIMNNVRFWRGGKEVEAPWVEEPKSWARYQPNSEGHMQGAYKALKKVGGIITHGARAKKVFSLGIYKSTYDELLGKVEDYEKAEAKGNKSQAWLLNHLAVIRQLCNAWLNDPTHQNEQQNGDQDMIDRAEALRELKNRVVANEERLNNA